MSNDFSPIEPTDNDAPMFAGVPSWERGKKRKSAFGARTSRVAAEPRSFAPEYAPEPGDPIPTRPATLSEDARAYEARMDAVDPTDTAFASGATFADRSSRKGNGAAPIMVAAGVILIGGLAAGGWYAMQPRNAGVAELTPGSTTTTTEVATTAPPLTTPQVAQNTVQAPPAPPARAVTTTTTHVPRGAVSHTTVTRAAPARSAADAGANASASAAPLRAAPQPAPAPAPTAAPPAPLVLNLPPQAAPPAEAPAPTQTAPATPPTQTPPS